MFVQFVVVKTEVRTMPDTLLPFGTWDTLHCLTVLCDSISGLCRYRYSRYMTLYVQVEASCYCLENCSYMYCNLKL